MGTLEERGRGRGRGGAEETVREYQQMAASHKAHTIDHDGEKAVVKRLQARQTARDDLVKSEVHQVSMCPGERREVGVGALEEGFVQSHAEVPLPAHQQDGEDANMKLANLT